MQFGRPSRHGGSGGSGGIAQRFDATQLDLALPTPLVFGSVRWSDDQSSVSGRTLVLAALDGSAAVPVQVSDGWFCAFGLPSGVHRAYVYDEKLAGHPPEGLELRLDLQSTLEFDLELLR